ncbi:type I polyketide synthase [Nocardia sp. CA-107356]|uniref:type I polyketide synthase n=1 Tax=Nocardia sp. CA-107356 TaxID=3239972 RepID=UPI003D8F0D59
MSISPTSRTEDRIAIVGLGCRFAGDLDSPDALWEFLLDKQTAVGTIPDDRWAAHRAHSREHAAVLTRVTPRGAFRSEISGFDATFFGISATEAGQLDPQQRIALEVAWEALEHAGIPPHSLAGTDAGVFMGVGADDYGRRLLENLPEVQAWTGIGASPCAVANRISYTLDLRGPSLAVDTACSSSLVALHQAVTALLRHETPLALAGGVMLMAGPGLTTVLDQAGAISKDGRSKPFDAAADGYGRGEGCGIAVLKRLSDAERDGDRVLAVIRGSAVNQDGRTDGIMAPSRTAQEHLLRRAYAVAGVHPHEVDYIEAHGTGTKVGDPIEAGALAAVVGRRPEGAEPCLIGSVKGNVGHTEAAAGIAGVIKTVLAICRGVIPPTVRVAGSRTEIPWAESGLRVVTEATPWPPSDRPRSAGVASYGYGGTIAHIVLEQAPATTKVTGAESNSIGTRARADAAPDVRIYPVSSATRVGLAAHAAALLEAAETVDIADMGHTLALRRSHLNARAAVVAADRTDLIAGLRALSEARTESGVVSGDSLGAVGDPVWVFSGHGAQWAGMGQELLRAEPVFAEVIDRIGPIYREEMGLTPRRVLESGKLESVDVIQAMLVAVQLGLAALWRHYGVRPGAVIGHSVGEIAAAVTAGVLTEAEGAMLACRRSNLLRKVAGDGAMIMVDRPFEQVVAQLGARRDAEAAICAAPSSTVIAGAVDAIDTLSIELPELGWTVRRVDSDIAFHSAQMEPLAADLAVAVAELEPAPATVPLYVTAVPDPRSAPRQGAQYWAQNLRNAVRFHQATEAAIADGHRVFLEVAAHPVVSHSILETLSANGIDDALVLPSLRRNKPERPTLLGSVAALHCRGLAIDWTAAASGGQLVDLPTNSWQHQRHWVDGPAGRETPVDTLLGAQAAVQGTSVQVWPTTLDFRTRPYPQRHPVLGTEITPAAVLLNTLFAAGDTTELADVQLKLPVVVPEPEQIRELQVVRDGSVLRIVSRRFGGDDAAWSTHTLARIGTDSALTRRNSDTDDSTPGATAMPADNDSLDPDFVVDRLAELGVAEMGYPWRIDSLRRLDNMLLAAATAELDRSWAAMLDAALSMASVIFPGPAILRMPAHIDSAAIDGPAPRQATISVRLRSDRSTTVDVTVTDGDSIATLTGLRYAELESDAGTDTLSAIRYHLEWLPVEIPVAHDTVRSTITNTAESTLPGAGAHVVFAPTAVRPFDGAAEFAALVGRIAALPADRRPTLWVSTRGVREGATALAPLWGMGRVAASEHPDFFGGVIDLLPNDPDTVAHSVIRASRTDPVVSIRDGKVFAQRLVPAERTAIPFACRPDGTYLITGGLGALGLLLAEHLAERGARRIVLLGRRALPTRSLWSDTDERTVTIRRLEEVGVTVRTVAADITDRAATESALAALDLPPIRGVVHAAGTVDSAMLHDLDPETLRKVMSPKVDGALVLHELFPPGSTDFFVLFSSAGPLLGLPGQGSYAAANSFLDTLAAQRRASGHRETVSIAWTSWRGLGMSTSAAATDLELAARGTADLTAEQALRVFDDIVAHADSPVAVALTVLRQHPGLRPALLSALDFGTDQTDTAGSEWAELTGDELASYLFDLVHTRAASTLGTDPDALSPYRPLTETGIDSLLATALRANLERHLGIPLPATLLWNYPTITDIARYLTEQMSPDAG